MYDIRPKCIFRDLYKVDNVFILSLQVALDKLDSEVLPKVSDFPRDLQKNVQKQKSLGVPVLRKEYDFYNGISEDIKQFFRGPQSTELAFAQLCPNLRVSELFLRETLILGDCLMLLSLIDGPG